MGMYLEKVGWHTRANALGLNLGSSICSSYNTNSAIYFQNTFAVGKCETGTFNYNALHYQFNLKESTFIFYFGDKSSSLVQEVHRLFFGDQMSPLWAILS